MLINFKRAVEEHGLKVKGIIQAGAHHGQEHKLYKSMGVKDIVYIEPCQIAFGELMKHVKSEALLFNCALGDTNGEQYMFTDNIQGMSNSLLSPSKHLIQHPKIEFPGTEKVKVKTLDDLIAAEITEPEKYNMLVMDCQGYEAHIVRGGRNTIKHIDIIYTEVNRDDVYSGCVRVEELDEMLHDFVRVETRWEGMWGDAIYKRTNTGEFEERAIGKKIARMNVPAEFKTHHPFPYPKDNDLIFEEWFDQHTQDYELGFCSRIYLPVYWTGYYVKHNFGQDKRAIALLQRFIDSLDKSKSYFTIVQYDDGILNSLDGLDIKVFAMSGKRIDFPLPLICKPHKINYRPSWVVRTYFMSFQGKLTHPIRKKMMEELSDKKDIYISTGDVPLDRFCETMSFTKFALCPRGYGQTSFRICEALQFGAIPVYISDDFIQPFEIDFSDYGILFNPAFLSTLEETLRAIPQEQIDILRKNGKYVYENFFTYLGCKEQLTLNV